MLKQISMNHELVLKDRGFAHIPDALRFQCHTFESLLVLDLQGNSIIELDDDFCQNFPCLNKLDVRNNRIKTISPHIKALMSLNVLRLDNNNLVQLVPQIGNLKLLEELSVSNNRIHDVPYSLGESLTQLHTLNLADNSIKSLPASLGNLGKYSLKSLFLHGNSFTSFPSSFLHMCNLEELSLEWFLYAKPSKPKLRLIGRWGGVILKSCFSESFLKSRWGGAISESCSASRNLPTPGKNGKLCGAAGAALEKNVG